MIVHTQGPYTVKYMGTKHVSGSATVNGELITVDQQGFVFNLFKNDVFFKTHVVAAIDNEPAIEVISSVIEIFKKYMV